MCPQMPGPFYKVVLDGSPADADPFMLWEPAYPVDLRIGSTIPVLSFEPLQFHLGETIAWIDEFNKFDDARKQAMVEDLLRHQSKLREGEIIRIETDAEPGCLGRLVVREVTRPSESSG
jgi:hypothetical protein